MRRRVLLGWGSGWSDWSCSDDGPFGVAAELRVYPNFLDGMFFHISFKITLDYIHSARTMPTTTAASGST